jgi:hypothetical protein
MTLRAWVEAIVAAAITGAAGAVLTYLENANASLDQLKNHALLGAVLGVALLFKESPLRKGKE